MTQAGKRLIAGAEEALAVVRGESEPHSTTIFLDRRHKAVRTSMRWDLYERLSATGIWRQLDQVTGPRKTIYILLERHGIIPSREADAQLNLLPERSSFREDTPEPRQE